MKGEFVEAKKSYSIECFDGEDWYTVNRTHPDFALAVAALQSLIQPKQAVPLAGVHPGVGLRWCGEEEPFGWGLTGGDHARHRFAGGKVQWWNWVDCKWQGPFSEVTSAFEAGRRYERERGCAYVSDKPWTHQS